MEQKGKRDEEEARERERKIRVLLTATVNHQAEETRETERKSPEISSLNEGEKKSLA